MTTDTPARKATRVELLDELGRHVSARAVARASELCTDEQIAANIKGCRAQLEWYRSCGFEDAAAGPLSGERRSRREAGALIEAATEYTHEIVKR